MGTASRDIPTAAADPSPGIPNTLTAPGTAPWPADEDSATPLVSLGDATRPQPPGLGSGAHRWSSRGDSPPRVPRFQLYESEEPPETWESKRRRIPLVVDVAWHNFEHFKNHYSPTDGLAIIEVLRGHHNIAEEVTREERLRAKSRKRRDAGPNISVTDSDDFWIQRVRIQSPQLITILSRLTGHRDTWATDKPRVFFPPFRSFYYFLPQIRECRRILEEKCQSGSSADATAKSSLAHDHEDGDSSDDSSSFSSGASDDGLDDTAGFMDTAVAVSGDLIDPPTALEHVRRYIEFVEEHIVPRWNDAAGTSKRKVRFNDLWMSFKPGELIYVPSESDAPANAPGKRRVNRNVSQTAWRLYSMVLSSVKDDTPNDIHLAKKERKESKRCLDLHCYYIDYDGISYVPVRNMFCISDYDGERDITSLPFYPMRFAKDADKITAELARNGAWFCQAIRTRHLRYDGWTLPYGPAAEGTNSHVDPRDSQQIVHAPVEHVDGDVMIDFQEGFKSEPAIGPDPSSWSIGLRDFTDSDWPVGDDNIYIKHWEKSDSGQFIFVGDIKEKTQRGEWYCEKMANDHLSSKTLLKTYKAGNIITDLDEDDLVLLPRRVVGYSFRERKFFMLDVRFLKPLPTSQNAFRDLKIDEGHKKMIKSLIKTHLRQHTGHRQRQAFSHGHDLIRGKGAGLFILLHGVPGVGKTATAEAVAQASKKPLFPITCGDLGVSPQEVDAALTGIFRLANLWDCVLLLDEADVFLSRRELGDLERNALVSVFLRVLEYYNGILFLTTNRVGTLDEAFKSRIHLSLYYPPLDLDQTLAIFRVNIRKLREMDENNRRANSHHDSPNRPRLIIKEESILHYAQWYFEVNDEFSPEQKWNGRQIRNAFQIAYSLAHFDMQKTSIDEWEDEDDASNNPNSARSLVLDYKQFDMVAQAMEKFEDYLYEATGATDKDKAAAKHTRADDFDHHQWEQKHVYRPQVAARHRKRPKYVPPEERGHAPAAGTGTSPNRIQSGQQQHQFTGKQPQLQRGGSHSAAPILQAQIGQKSQQTHQRHLSVPGSGSSSGLNSSGRPLSPQQRTSPARGKQPRHHSSPVAAAGQPSSRMSSTTGGTCRTGAAGSNRRASSGTGYSGWSVNTPRTTRFDEAGEDLPAAEEEEDLILEEQGHEFYDEYGYEHGYGDEEDEEEEVGEYEEGVEEGEEGHLDGVGERYGVRR